LAPMSLFCVLAALVLDQLRPLPHPSPPERWFVGYADRLAHGLNAGQPSNGAIGWILAVVPWVAAAVIVHYVLKVALPTLGWVLAWAWDAIVLYACIRLRHITQDYTAVADALKAGELERARELIARWRGEPATDWSQTEIARAAIETAFLRAHRDLLALIAWFVVLPGPAGAVLYKLSAMLADQWGRRADDEFGRFGAFAVHAFRILDWVPLRITAIGFAIAGDFEDAVQCWRAQYRAWADPDVGVILSSGAGALGVRLGGPLPKEGGVQYRPELGLGDEPDANYMQSAVGLIWRTLVIGMIALLVITLASWVGG